MSNYNKIIQSFKGLGYHQNTQFSQGELNRALDTLCNKTMRIPQFDRNVSSQLWDQTQKQAGGTVLLNDFIETTVKGINILENQIELTQKQIQRTDNQNNKEALNEDLLSYSEDYQFLTQPFGIKPNRNTKISQNSIMNSRKTMSNNTSIFIKDANESGSGTDLKIVFVITFILLLLQITLMFHKHHFYNILAYISVFGVFFLNYFDKTYMKFVLINLGISVILDLVWMIVSANEYWYPNTQTQHSTIHSGFLKFIVIFTPIIMIIKLIIVCILFKYRNNAQTLKRKISFLGMTFNLNGNPADNLFTNVIEGRQQSNNFVD